MEEESQDTIVTDVIETEETKKDAIEEQLTERPLSQRDLAMQSILAGRQGHEEEDGGEIEEKEEEVDDSEITLKVDGVEVKTSRDKVLEAGIRSLQKESAADKRLKEAATKEAELAARQAELARMEQDLLNKRNQQEEIEPDETGRAFADALFTDEETVAKTITSITKRLNDVAGKVDKAQQTEEVKQKTEFAGVVKHYHTNYGDIAADPDMHFAMNRIQKEVAAEDPSLSRTQLIDRAAEKVYQKFGVKKGDPVVSAASSRKSAKERMPAPIKRASARVEPTPAEKPKKPSEVLDAMRQNRGPRPY